MPLSSLDRVVLYWFWNRFEDDCDDEALGMLGVHVNPDAKDRHLRERECFIAGEALPTYEEGLESLQNLAESGYVDTGAVVNFRDSNIDRWRTPVSLTARGEEEAKVFNAMLQSEEGRRKTFDFAETDVTKSTAHLPFTPMVPKYLPDSVDPLPEVSVTDDSVTLDYNRVVVQQGRGELPSRHNVPPNDELLREESTQRTAISVAERHVTSVWAEIELTWRNRDTFVRLTFIKIDYQPTAQASFTYAVIDESMREEARKIARSMIEQVEN